MSKDTTEPLNIDTDVKIPKTSNNKGKPPKERKQALKTAQGKLQANQWQNTPQQALFMQSWLDPKSSTFGNAYQSALRAGYSDRYAQLISTPTIGNKWLSEYKNRLILTDEHIKQGITELAISSNNAKSPDDTRLKALETLARIQGMLNGNTTTVNIVQPILGGTSTTSVKSDIIDV